MYIQRVLAYTFSRHVSPTNLRFSFGSCRFRCIIFVLLLTCLAAFALTLLVCLFACRRKRNDRTRRGPMQRGATLPLPSRWPSTKGCSNTCGQPHWAPPGVHTMRLKSNGRPFRSASTATGAPNRLTSKSRLAFGKCTPDLHLAPNLHKGHHSPNHNSICFLSLYSVLLYSASMTAVYSTPLYTARNSTSTIQLAIQQVRQLSNKHDKYIKSIA